MNLRSISSLPDEVYAAGDIYTQLLEVRGEQSMLLLQTPDQYAHESVSSTSTYLRSSDTFIIIDNHASQLFSASFTDIQRINIPENISTVISLTKDDLTYWSESVSSVVRVDLNTHRKTFIAYSEDPPVIFENGFYAGGILGLSNKSYPIDLLLAADPAIPKNTNFLDLFNLFSEQLMPELTLSWESTAGSAGLGLLDTRLQEQLKLAADLSGTYLYLQPKFSTHYSSAVVIDLAFYFAAEGIDFFGASASVSYAGYDQSALASSITPLYGGFQFISKSGTENYMHVIDANSLASVGSRVTNPILPISLGGEYSMHKNSDYGQYFLIKHDNQDDTLQVLRAEANFIQSKTSAELQLQIDSNTAILKIGTRRIETALTAIAAHNLIYSGADTTDVLPISRDLKDHKLSRNLFSSAFEFETASSYLYYTGDVTADVKQCSPTSVVVLAADRLVELSEIATASTLSPQAKRFR